MPETEIPTRTRFLTRQYNDDDVYCMVSSMIMGPSQKLHAQNMLDCIKAIGQERFEKVLQDIIDRKSLFDGTKTS